jgi:DNA-binding response OmpR family regulator
MKRKILLVEDTIHLAEEISDMLKFEGYEVTLANGGMQALQLLSGVKPDIIITDLLMPGLDGFQLIEQIRKMSAYKAIPIVILSAKAAEEDRVRGLQVGADAFIVKPCKSHVLVEIIKKLTGLQQ